MNSPRVIIIVLNTNRREDTLACLASLNCLDYPQVETLVVDNASPDGSVAEIRRRYPAILLIESGGNLGYVGGNNVGIRYALDLGVDYILILNEDTIVDPGMVRGLVAVAETDATVGIAGPKVYHYDTPDMIQSIGGGFTRGGNSYLRGAGEPDRGQYEQVAEVSWISGCAMLIRRAVFEQIGLLDPAFYMSWEDTDYCMRARRSGFKVVVAPHSKLWHKGASPNEAHTPRMTYYRARNHLLFLRKHKAGLGKILVTIGQNVRTLASWSIRPKWRSLRPGCRNALFMALIDFGLGRTGCRGNSF